MLDIASYLILKRPSPPTPLPGRERGERLCSSNLELLYQISVIFPEINPGIESELILDIKAEID
jgi:hypothetical protein